MARKRRDFMDVPAGASEIRQAEVTKRVRREAEDTRDASDTRDSLRPRPDAEGATAFRFDTDKNSGPRARLIARRSRRYDV
jgi:hypothetical protein